MYTLQTILDLALERWPPRLPKLDGSSSGKLLREFNKNSDTIVQTYGAEDAGQLVWSLYGAGGLGHAAFGESSDSEALATLRTVRELYLNGFGKHCTHRIGEEWPTKLDLACYMLWDMDGGLKFAAFRTRYEMESAALAILETCLMNENESVQESALQALNHLYYDRPEISVKLINRYLSHSGRTHAAIAYAQDCREGRAQ